MSNTNLVVVCGAEWCKDYGSQIAVSLHRHQPKDGQWPIGICQRCVEEGKRSKVYPSMFSTRTAMGTQQFYDEDGRLHSHDPNKSTTSYHCDRGHHWLRTTTPGCSGCDRPSKTEVVFQ